MEGGGGGRKGSVDNKRRWTFDHVLKVLLEAPDIFAVVNNIFKDEALEGLD